MEKLLKALEEHFPTIDFMKEKHLYSDGIFDSLAMVDVVGILAEEYGVFVPMDELEPANFESIETILELIERIQ